MQKITFKNSRNQILVGHWYSVGSKAIIIMAHGFTSDKSSRGRFERLAAVFNQSGFDALAFDFSGCGESDDAILTIGNEVDDLKAAIQFVQAKGYQKIALYGHSLGSLICLKVFTPEITTMVLTGALTAAMHYDWNVYYTNEQLLELKEKGYLTDSRLERPIKISQQLLNFFAEINQQELLKNITCPIFIIHGNNDEEEKMLSEGSKKAIQLLPKGSRLEIIHRATHSFLEHFDTVVELASKWFLKHLSN